jgi:ribosomal-protein-alanine N-acetyltransferase
LILLNVAIETDRLRLARPRENDAEAIFTGYSSDAEVTRYVGWPRHESVAQAAAFVEFSDQEWTQNGCGPYLIWSRTGTTLLGGTGLHVHESGRAETGYVLAKAAWGKGYATEALRAVILAAQPIGIGHLFALCHADHRASAHVLEKCHFTFDRLMPDQTFPNLTPPRGSARHYTLNLLRV